MLSLYPRGPSAAPSICNTLDRLATEVWSTIQLAHQQKMSLGEETITDLVLLDLATRHPADVVVHKFSKREEATTGADWEWWFTAGGLWWGMRIQAKILNPATLRYTSLRHRNRKKLQINALLATAQARGLYAAYCFYNYWDPTRFAPTSACVSGRSSPAHGCTLADASYVKRTLLGAKRSDQLFDLLPGSYPWSCPLCCAVVQGNLAERVKAFVERWLLPISQKGVPRSRRKESVQPLRRDPPAYVAALLTRRDVLDGSNVEVPTDIDGILIIQDRAER